MRGKIIIMLCVLLAVGYPVHVFATDTGEAMVADSGAAVTDAQGAVGAADLSDDGESGCTLKIDTNIRYKGMDQPYKKGYTPTVSGGKATVVLPLISSDKLKGDKLTAGVDLGATENTPFIYKNYQKTFRLDTKKKIYGVCFGLSLSGDRQNGVYPVVINVDARTVKGEDIAASFTVYVTITDGREPDVSGSSEGASAGEIPPSQPVVLIRSCKLDAKKIKAGESFQAKIAVGNTSETTEVRNMVLSLDYDTEKFTCLEESESIYIAGLATGQTIELPLKFRTAPNTPEGSYKISIEMTYEDGKATALSSKGTITIPVKQGIEVSLTLPQIPEPVSAGDTLPLDFQVLNMGRGTVYNVRCDVEGEGLVATSTAFAGNLEAGTEGNASMNLFISAKEQAGESGTAEKYGSTDGIITLTYENAEGKEYTEEFPFKTTINEPVIPAAEPKEEKKTAGQWWISILESIDSFLTGPTYRGRLFRTAPGCRILWSMRRHSSCFATAWERP